MASHPTPVTDTMQVPNTLALPCTALCALEYRHSSQLADLQSLFLEHGTLAVLGGASNVILPQTLEPPLVLMRNQGIEYVGQTQEHWLVEVAAGESWHQWVQASLQHGWPGLENLALIPGTVGAAPVQNIGAYGVELEQRIDAVQIWDLQHGCLQWLSRQQCRFGYRDSVFKHEQGRHWVVLKVRFALPRQWQANLNYPDLQDLRQVSLEPDPWLIFNRVVSVREAKLPDPVSQPNVGSFFKNPIVGYNQAQSLKRLYPNIVQYAQPDGRVKLAAGWLIDQCGFKGRRMGPVAVHDRQALVLVNTGGATAQDVMSLAQAIRAAVSVRFGVCLEMEPARWDI